MSAIPTRYRYPLELAIVSLKGRMNALHQVSFTHDEFLSLFAPEEDHRILHEAARVANITGGGSHYAELTSPRFAQYDASVVHLHLIVHAVDDSAPLLPRNTVILPDAPAHLVRRLADWACARIEQNFQFSLCARLLDWLGNNCNTPRQLRYLWPSIITLASLREDTQDFADRLRELKCPTSLPVMPEEVRAAFQPTAAIIAAASLLPESEKHIAPVTVAIHSGAVRRKAGVLGWISGI